MCGYITHNGGMLAPAMGAPATDLLSVDLLDHDLFADHEPWEVFDLLQRDAPVYHHPEPDGRGFWALTKYDDVVSVLRDTKTFSSEIGGAATIEDLPEDVLAARRNFLEFDPPKHGRYRRLISRNFTPGAVGQYEVWLRELVRHRLDAALALGEFDLVHELAAPIPIRVLAHVLGLPEEILPHLIRARRSAAGRYRSRVRGGTGVRTRARGGPVTSLSARHGPRSCARSGATSTTIAGAVPATTSSR